MPRIQAVLAGDLIGSRKMGRAAVDDSMAALQTAARGVAHLYGLDLRFTRYRGDGWQLLLRNPGLSLELCMALTARLRAAATGLDTRIAVGVGSVESPGTKDLGDASGPAFLTAGDLLDRMTRHMTERWMIAGAGTTKCLQGLMALGAAIAGGWTAAQSEAVALVLLDADLQTNDRRAQSLGITRQAFEARLKAARFDDFALPRDAFGTHDFAETGA